MWAKQTANKGHLQEQINKQRGTDMSNQNEMNSMQRIPLHACMTRLELMTQQNFPRSLYDTGYLHYNLLFSEGGGIDLTFVITDQLVDTVGAESL